MCLPIFLFLIGELDPRVNLPRFLSSLLTFLSFFFFFNFLNDIFVSLTFLFLQAAR